MQYHATPFKYAIKAGYANMAHRIDQVRRVSVVAM